MRLRPPRFEDLTAAFEVIEARQIADLGLIDLSLEDLRDEWQRSEFDLAADARVIEDEDSSVVGCGMVGAPEALAAVKPSAEGNGAGTRLLDWLEQRQLEQGHSQHQQIVAATNASAANLLGARGYRLLRSYQRMVRYLDDVPASQAPLDVEIRQFAAEDAQAVHALDDRAFAGAPDYAPHSLTAFREEHLESHNSAPDLSLTAWIDGQVVGFLLTRIRANGTVGYIEILAVDPEHQGEGIGRALLLHAFARFAAAGLQEAQLGVSSDNPRARDLYESAGMTPLHRHDVYERPITNSA